METKKRLVLIKSGNDWVDGCAEVFEIPQGLDLPAEHANWKMWYSKEYLPSVRLGGIASDVKFVSFDEWLEGRGARYIEIEEFWDE